MGEHPVDNDQLLTARLSLRRPTRADWVIRLRDGHQPAAILGFCGLKLMKLGNRDVLNLFYRLAPAAWGDGVATEAATAVVAWATTHLPDRPVIARIRPGNIASARVATRAGLRRAEHLDNDGEDGLDWIYTKNCRDESSSTPMSSRPPGRRG